VSVAVDAPASVTNIAFVSGGGDVTPDTATDLTVINPSGSGGGYAGVLAGWDVSGQTNYGASPFAAGTNAPNVTVSGLARGADVSTNGSAAARGWGGVAFTNTSVATAVASNIFVTFSVTAKAGYRVTCSSISRFDYRRSGTGPADGILQFQIGTGTFSDITNLSYTSTSTSGASLAAIDLSGVTALQNIGAGTNITFRVVNYGGGSAGTWYVFDTAGTSGSPNRAHELVVQCSVTPVGVATNPPAGVPTFSLAGFTNHEFQFTVSGTAGSNYVVQATAALNPANWISIATNAVPFVFIDTNQFSQRYYRSLIAP
jgi:hypothetical protein